MDLSSIPHQRRCACGSHNVSCPAARLITWPLSEMRRLRREKRRRAARALAPKNLVALLRSAFNDTCQYCGASGSFDATADRISPSGGYVAHNVTLACRRCNSKKGRSDRTGQVLSFADVGGQYV